MQKKKQRNKTEAIHSSAVQNAKSCIQLEMIETKIEFDIDFNNWQWKMQHKTQMCLC